MEFERSSTIRTGAVGADVPTCVYDANRDHRDAWPPRRVHDHAVDPRYRHRRQHVISASSMVCVGPLPLPSLRPSWGVACCTRVGRSVESAAFTYFTYRDAATSVETRLVMKSRASVIGRGDPYDFRPLVTDCNFRCWSFDRPRSFFNEATTHLAAANREQSRVWLRPFKVVHRWVPSRRYGRARR